WLKIEIFLLDLYFSMRLLSLLLALPWLENRTPLHLLWSCLPLASRTPPAMHSTAVGRRLVGLVSLNCSWSLVHCPTSSHFLVCYPFFPLHPFFLFLFSFFFFSIFHFQPYSFSLKNFRFIHIFTRGNFLNQQFLFFFFGCYKLYEGKFGPFTLFPLITMPAGP